jgi:hypothetical protein
MLKYVNSLSHINYYYYLLTEEIEVENLEVKEQ